MSRRKERVPAKPFADWLDRRVKFYEDRPALAGPAGAIGMVLNDIGWTGDAGARRLFRYRYLRVETARGRKRHVSRGISFVKTADEYPRDVVEEALHHAGVMFAEVYPEIAAAEDRELEPETWCPGCQDMCTPIDGQCPWCEWWLVPTLGEREAA